jgi:glycosyltransferase involved in cell wall biosynthesis
MAFGQSFQKDGPWPAMKSCFSILFTIPNFITAGSGGAMLNIIERLDRKRFAPAVCVLRKGGDLDRRVDQMGIPFIEIPFTVAPKPYLTLSLRAWKAARRLRPHHFALWHSFHYSDDYTEAIIARMAGARAWIYTKKNMGWGSRAWRLRTRFATRVAAQNSDMMRSFFGNGSFHPKARPIPRGVDSARFVPDAAPKLGLRSQYRIPSDAIVVACVAQLVPVKGHPTLLEALASVPEVHLLIAGTPLEEDYTASLHQQAARLDLSRRVHFLGSVKDVPALLAESEIFALPTWAKWRMEGCPVALLEAMSCGRACVATDVPGSRDLLENGHSGLIVPPEDPGALAAALTRLVGSPELRQQMGRAARQRVLDHFTIEKEVDAHEALYAEVLGLN